MNNKSLERAIDKLQPTVLKSIELEKRVKELEEILRVRGSAYEGKLTEARTQAEMLAAALGKVTDTHAGLWLSEDDANEPDRIVIRLDNWKEADSVLANYRAAKGNE